MDVKKIFQGHIVTITIWLTGLVFAALIAYIAYSMQPLVQNLAILDNRVDAVEGVHKQLSGTLATKQEILDIIQLQLQDNTKARIIDEYLQNNHLPKIGLHHRSQLETYELLRNKYYKVFADD